MLYEPGMYIIEYEIGAFAIFLVIMMRYYSVRHFPCQTRRMATLIQWVTVINIILDVASAHAIENALTLPVTLIYLINTAFYATTVLLLVLMMLYTIALVDYIDANRMKRILPLMLPGIIVLLMFALNPLTGSMFYIDSARGYIHGDLFIALYIACFVYLCFTFIIACKNRKAFRHLEFSTIIFFLAVVLASTVVQYFVPSLLITGISIMFAVTLMYFTIQNPETVTDVTTGAFTYESLLTFLQTRKQENEYVQIVAIKIQNMSRINGLLGIENGSLLLEQVFEFMSASCKDVWVFRLRGSCFVAITHNQKDFETLYARMREKTEKAWMVGTTEVLLRADVCSIVTSRLFDRPISPEETVRLLETAFSQKAGTDERVRFIAVDSTLISVNERKRSVESALRDALATGQGLDLFFQPLWSIEKSRFNAAEVLLRFNHPELGSVPPNEFVEIAENCGLVTELDEWVVRKTCELIEKCDFASYGIDMLEINLSALEFMHIRLPELLDDIMKRYSVKPNFLCFEITETAATESFELLCECMQKIREFGCSFALDDFGVGYANISKVLELPFTTIKLDKSLLYHSGEVIADMSSMFNRMGRRVVAEGVETAEQAELCCSCKIDYIQGFYYARPMNHRDFTEFLIAKNRQPTHTALPD